MNIELRTVTSDVKKRLALLEVSDSQKQYIASNSASLKTAAKEEYKGIARPFAIYANGELVGFTMFAFDLASRDPNDRYWLWRFMIDKSFQSKGYGSAALKAVIEYFKSHRADHILLSTKASNAAALSLYHKFGFSETGEMNGDESVLRLSLQIIRSG